MKAYFMASNMQKGRNKTKTLKAYSKYLNDLRGNGDVSSAWQWILRNLKNLRIWVKISAFHHIRIRTIKAVIVQVSDMFNSSSIIQLVLSNLQNTHISSFSLFRYNNEDINSFSFDATTSSNPLLSWSSYLTMEKTSARKTSRRRNNNQ